jgi:hypothetical protein
MHVKASEVCKISQNLRVQFPAPVPSAHTCLVHFMQIATICTCRHMGVNRFQHWPARLDSESLQGLRKRLHFLNGKDLILFLEARSYCLCMIQQYFQ